jgi:transposase InsO family protein
MVAAEPGILLSDILDRIEGVTNGTVFGLIARKKVYVDLRVAWLGEPERVRIYRDKTTASFFERLSEAQVKDDNITPRVTDLVPDSPLLFNNARLKIIFVGRTDITLRREDGGHVHFSNTDFEQFMRDGRVTGFMMRPEIQRISNVYEIAKRIETEEEMAETLRRLDIVRRRRAGEKLTGKVGVTDRTMRNWQKSYDLAEAEHGNGALGLVPQHGKKGNRKERFGERLKSFVLEAIQTEFVNVRKKTKTLIFGAFVNLCERNGIPKPPTYKTFIKVIKKLRNAAMVKETDGSKIAYQIEEFLERSDPDMPIHGDRPWEYVHIDHTELDLELLHSETFKNMGKAWVTLMIDACSRRVLAYYLTFDPPSYRSLLGVMRECVQRNGRLPECVIVDQGKDLKSIYFEKLLARYKCSKIERPPSKPRFGSIIERSNDTTNKQLIHNLLGNTKIMKNARQVTKEVNPKNLAVWNLPMLDEKLASYFYEEYDNRQHSALGMSPREAYEARMKRFDMPKPEIKYDDNFIKETLPRPRKGTAQIAPQRGIKVNGHWYSCDKFRNPELHKTRVQVRYDPFNMAIVYAQVGKVWEVCLAPLRLYSLLKNRSEREMKLIFEEERQKYRAYGRIFNERAKEMALKQASVEANEKVEEQRKRDDELRKTAKSRGNCHSAVSQLSQPVADHKPQDGTQQEEKDQTSKRCAQPRVFGSAKRAAS